MSGQNAAQKVVNAFGCSQEKALEFLMHCGNEIRLFQSSLELIASSETSAKNKAALKKLLINMMCEKEARVLVSSTITSDTVFSYSIDEYLFHLSNLSAKYPYKSIELFFKSDYVNLVKLVKIKTNSTQECYDMLTTLRQYFAGFYKEHGAYYDQTDKNLRYIVSFDAKKNLSMRLKSITIKETVKIGPDKYKAQKDLEFSRRQYRKLMAKKK